MLNVRRCFFFVKYLVSLAANDAGLSVGVRESSVIRAFSFALLSFLSFALSLSVFSLSLWIWEVAKC